MIESVDPWADATYQLADDIRFWPSRQRETPGVRLESENRGKFYYVGQSEYVLLSLYDGHTNIAKACGLAAERLGPDAPDMRQTKALTQWAVENGILHFAQEGVTSRTSTPETNIPPESAQGMDLLSLRFPLPGSEKWVTQIADRLVFLANPTLFSLGWMLLVATLIGLALNWSTWTEASSDIIAMDNWLWLFLTWCGLKVAHELGHAVACRRFQGTIGDSGIAIILLTPMAYIDVTSCWRFNSRWKRIVVSAAGMWVEMVLASCAFWVWLLCDNSLLRFHLQNIMVSASVATVLCNANFLMKFDGYYILADVLNFPNLQSAATQSLNRTCRRLFSGTNSPPTIASRSTRWCLTGYGVLIWGWRLAVIMTVLLAIHALIGPVGTVVIGSLMLTRVRRSFVNLVSDLSRWWHAEPIRFWRTIGSLSVVAGTLLSAWFFVPISPSVHVQALTDTRSDSAIRSQVEGWIESIHVEHGQIVQQGQPVCTLRNHQIQAQLRSVEIELAQNEMRMQQAIQDHDVALLQQIRAARTALLERVVHHQMLVDSLTIRAHRAGMIIARRLPTLETLARAGDPLLTIADPLMQEVVAYVDQDDLRCLHASLDNTVRMSAQDGRELWGRIRSIRPRATDHLPHEALSAAFGGVLPTYASPSDQEDSSGLRLLSPHFECRLQIENPQPLDEFPMGMRLTIQLQSQGRTLHQLVTKWFAKQLRGIELVGVSPLGWGRQFAQEGTFPLGVEGTLMTQRDESTRDF